jgi:hypothetical protein
MTDQKKQSSVDPKADPQSSAATNEVPPAAEAIEEDDEFEEFENCNWGAKDEDVEDAQQWQVWKEIVKIRIYDSIESVLTKIFSFMRRTTGMMMILTMNSLNNFGQSWCKIQETRLDTFALLRIIFQCEYNRALECSRGRLATRYGWHQHFCVLGFLSLLVSGLEKRLLLTNAPLQFISRNV